MRCRWRLSRRRRLRSRRRQRLSRRRSRRRRRSHRETKSGGGVDGVGDDNLFMFVFVVEWNFSSACKTGLLAKHSHRLIIAPTSAMARLLIAVLAVTTTSAFKTPKRALKVRGGVDIQKVGTALIGLGSHRLVHRLRGAQRGGCRHGTLRVGPRRVSGSSAGNPA